MSITDELRKWAEDNTLKDRVLTTYPPQHAVHGVLETLLRIADRIDAEHERAAMSAMNDALYYANDESMAELGWVRLPVDADGVPIRVGDVVDVTPTDKFTGHMNVVVTSVIFKRSAALVTVDTADRPFTFWPNRIRHHHAPTVEDALCELLNEYREGGCTLEEARLSDFAAKLRLAGDAE